jgi:thioredoxin 1
VKSLQEATTNGSFEAALASDKPLIADFYTPACILCKRMEPMLAAVAGDFEGRLDVVKVDAAANLETAAKYDIRGVPTLILFVKGKVQDRKTGFMTAAMLRDWIRPLM